MEIPTAGWRRSTGSTTSFDRAKKEVPALRWADLSAGQYGVSLINASKYGYDIKGNLMRLSLLRSPKYPDPFADMGKHSIRYALYAPCWIVAGGQHRSNGDMSIDTPLIVRTNNKALRRSPGSASFGTLDPFPSDPHHDQEGGKAATHGHTRFYEAGRIGCAGRAGPSASLPGRLVRSDFSEDEGEGSSRSAAIA